MDSMFRIAASVF